MLLWSLNLTSKRMLLRIVRMEFRPEAIADFEKIFEESSPLIRSFDGCIHVEMCSDPQNENVRYTFSRWENEEALEAYRHSEFFRLTWKKTKALFADKPKAYSLLSTLE